MAKRFDGEVLGMAVHNEGAGYCFLEAGRAFLVLVAAGASTLAPPTGNGIWLDIAVDDIAATRTRLTEAGAVIEREWADHNGLFVLTTDPDGNYIEVVQPPSPSR